VSIVASISPRRAPELAFFAGGNATTMLIEARMPPECVDRKDKTNVLYRRGGES
jgi:hypothetical protein